MHSLDRGRRCDDRQAVAHRQVDLPLDARAVTERGNRNAAAAEIGCHVGDVTGDDEIVGGQRFDRRWNQTADDDRLHARQLLANARQDFADIPQYRVRVRRVLEPADKHQALAFFERLACGEKLVDVRQDHDPRVRNQLGE